MCYGLNWKCHPNGSCCEQLAPGLWYSLEVCGAFRTWVLVGSRRPLGLESYTQPGAQPTLLLLRHHLKPSVQLGVELPDLLHLAGIFLH